MAELFADLPTQVSIDRQIEAVERELKLRARVYPRRVLNQQMTQRLADEEVAVMKAVLATLTEVKKERRT